jgi:ATP-dependent DNA helicase RecG
VTDLRSLGLNARQIEALRLMVNEGKELTNREYRQLFNVTNVTTFRDLDQLVSLEQAKVIGSGRSRKYTA